MLDTQIGIVRKCPACSLKALGNDCPKVAVLSAVENVTEKMASTVTAAEIARRGVPGLHHLRPPGFGRRYFHGVCEA
ncbi:MAG: hypothetical protein ACLUNQ_05335 [Oscillospiraceae bacterium]